MRPPAGPVTSVDALRREDHGVGMGTHHRHDASGPLECLLIEALHHLSELRGTMRTNRRKLRSGLSAAFAAALAVAGLTGLAATFAGRAAATPSSGYTWNNVQIAGGGFVPDIVFDEGAQNLVYARTDIGGAYRWNQASSTWTPLLDSVGWADWNRQGVVSIAA